MTIKHIDQFVRGWFVGDFEPSLLKTSGFEAAVQYYTAGDYEKRHVHKVATEITVVVYGEVEMNGVKHSKGAVVMLSPGEAADFRALTDAATAVVKIPSVKGDKYIV